MTWHGLLRRRLRHVEGHDMLVRVPDHLHCKCQEEAGDHVETSTAGRDVEAQVVVLALRAPLERPVQA